MNTAADNLTLHQLQSHFSAALRYQETASHCQIEHSTFSNDEKLQIYRNNFVISLTEALATTYPIVQLLVGNECFMQLARQHVLISPPKEGNVWGYGAGFSHTIRETEAVVSAVPYLPDIALLEWAIDTLIRDSQTDNCSAPHYPLNDINQVKVELQPYIQLRSIKNMTPFESDFSVFSVSNAVLTDSFSGVDPNQAERGVIVYLPLAPEKITTHILSDQQYRLLTDIHHNTCLGDINPELLTELNSLVQLGLITGFTVGEKI
jgi:hypothetical protein